MRRFLGRRLTVPGLLLALVAFLVQQRFFPRGDVADHPLGRGGPYPVVRVIDGDTIDVETNESLRKKERIRLLFINTPERDEPNYERATAALKVLVEGKSVELVFERESGPEPDAFQRLLAYVFLDGRNVNLEMVRGGWTRFFTKYGEGRFAAEFRAAEEEARSHDAGLWRDGEWNVTDDRPAARERR